MRGNAAGWLAPGALVSRRSLGLYLSIAEGRRGMTCRGDIGLVTHNQPAGHSVAVFSAFCPQRAPVGRFCRLCRLVSTVPSMLCDLNCSMASKRSSVRPRSGSQIARSKYQCDTLADRSTNRTGGRIRLVQLSVNSEKMTPRTTNVQSIGTLDILAFFVEHG